VVTIVIMWASAVVACVVVVSAGLLRRWPLLALALLVAIPVVASAMDAMRLGLGLLVLFYAAAGIEVCFIAATRPRRISLAATLMVFGVPATFVAEGLEMPVQLDVLVLLTTVIAWLAGQSVRQAAVQAEARRAQAQAQAAVTERLRIARELHDMVAHSIGIIAIQAGVGRRVIETQPAEARNALTAIEATSRETLAGLRQMLGVLRRAEPGPGRGPLESAPGLADLGRLAATTRDAGVRVELRWLGPRRPLPADIDLSAFRIIQEAVTNVIRHAGTGQCRVTVDCREEELGIEVTDEGRGGAPPTEGPGERGAIEGGGFGIDGMRERARLLGGELTAGPRAGGGFRVAARLPVPAAAP
jgi:signal transduction histidine kinase